MRREVDDMIKLKGHHTWWPINTTREVLRYGGSTSLPMLMSEGEGSEEIWREYLSSNVNVGG